MRDVRGVLFDFHETLISADRWFVMEIGGIAAEILQHLGVWGDDPPADERQRVEHTYAQLRAISVGAGVEYSAHEIGRVALRAIGRDGEVTEQDLAAAVDRLSRSYLPDVTLKPHVPETLGILARRGLRMGILSNAAHTAFLEWALEMHGVRGFFGPIVASGDLGIRKPRREIFAAALEAMGLAADETVYVGNDYLKDVMGAKLAGLRVIWVPDRSGEDYRPYTSIHPDAVAARFDALPAALDGLHEDPA
jgi:putative hydrolase of the HAD superfamily